MTLSLVLSIAAILLSAGVAALKLIAPATTNTTDDKILARLEAAEKALESLKA